MWLGFDSRTRCYMWANFFSFFWKGGSRPCSVGFDTGSPDFLPPQKPTFLKVPISSGAVDEEPHCRNSTGHYHLFFIDFIIFFFKPSGKKANLYGFPA